jgi:pimeloyl-ACP methyl ester carboxylesterase
VRTLAPAALERGILLIAPDRPAIGCTRSRRLERVADWVDDAALVLDAVGVERAAVLGISGGGPFAAACAACLGGRVSALILATALGHPDWGTRGMASGERVSLMVAARAPGFGGAFMGALARLPAPAFMRLSAFDMPAVDRETLSAPVPRQAFLDGYREAFRQGAGGVAQDLRLLTRPWGFSLADVRAPTWVHHGDADTTVPVAHARRFAEAITGAELVIHEGEGHFSLLARAAGEVLAVAA